MSPLAIANPQAPSSVITWPPFGYRMEESAQWEGAVDEILIYTDKYGVQTDLTTVVNEQYKEGLNGRFMAPIQHFSDAVPLQDGARYRGAQLQPNQLAIPITLVAPDVTSLRAKTRELMRALNPKRGPGTLTVHTVDGVSRYCSAVLEGGIPNDPAADGEEYDCAMVLIFRNYDAYWYDIKPVEREWQGVTSGSFFPILPVRLGAAEIFAKIIETNEGDDDAFPIWSLTGPGNDIEMVNELTGESMKIPVSIPAGTRIIIDTRPGSKSVTTEAGESVFYLLSGDLWPLVPGDNPVTVRLQNTDPTTKLSVQYQPRFVGV